MGGMQLNLVLAAKSRLLLSWSAARQIFLNKLHVWNSSNRHVLDVEIQLYAVVQLVLPQTWLLDADSGVLYYCSTDNAASPFRQIPQHGYPGDGL